MQFLKKHCQLSWEIAVYNANQIIDGLTDLTQRKLFISSFQNALELCFKQILLDRNNHNVINKKKGMNKALRNSYLSSTDLNLFCSQLSETDLNCIYSSDFNYIYKDALIGIPDQANIESLIDELKKFRNTETHFYIDESNYLKFDEFKRMIKLFKDIQSYLIGENIIDHLAFGHPDSSMRESLGYLNANIDSYNSYEDLIRNSKTNKNIANQFPDWYEWDSCDDIPSGLWFYVNDANDMYSISHEVYSHHGKGDSDLICLDILMNFEEFYRRMILLKQTNMLIIEGKNHIQKDNDENTTYTPFVIISKPVNL